MEIEFITYLNNLKFRVRAKNWVTKTSDLIIIGNRLEGRFDGDHKEIYNVYIKPYAKIINTLKTQTAFFRNDFVIIRGDDTRDTHFDCSLVIVCFILKIKKQLLTFLYRQYDDTKVVGRNGSGRPRENPIDDSIVMNLEERCQRLWEPNLLLSLKRRHWF